MFVKRNDFRKERLTAEWRPDDLGFHALQRGPTAVAMAFSALVVALCVFALKWGYDATVKREARKPSVLALTPGK